MLKDIVPILAVFFLFFFFLRIQSLCHLVSTKAIQFFFILITFSFSVSTFSTDYKVIKSFNIPKQGALVSLIKFAEQADITLLFPSENIQNLKTNSLIGKYSISKALRLLIKDTGLKMQLDDGGDFLIVVEPNIIDQRELDKKNKAALLAKAQKTTKIRKHTFQTSVEEVEVITIVGIKGSLKQSMNNKRFSFYNRQVN